MKLSDATQPVSLMKGDVGDGLLGEASWKGGKAETLLVNRVNKGVLRLMRRPARCVSIAAAVCSRSRSKVEGYS